MTAVEENAVLSSTSGYDGGDGCEYEVVCVGGACVDCGQGKGGAGARG